MSFRLHSLAGAGPRSRELLEKSQQSFGMIPNLHAVMAESPAVLEAYQLLHELFLQSSFSAEEKTVIWQTINIEHACHYCVPAHMAIATMMKVDSEVIGALRHGRELPTAQLETLRLTTLALLRERGRLSKDQRREFYAAGYTQRHLLEIILGMSQKVLSNYVNHQAATPLDEAFKGFL